MKLLLSIIRTAFPFSFQYILINPCIPIEGNFYFKTFSTNNFDSTSYCKMQNVYVECAHSARVRNNFLRRKFRAWSTFEDKTVFKYDVTWDLIHEVPFCSDSQLFTSTLEIRWVRWIIHPRLCLVRHRSSRGGLTWLISTTDTRHEWHTRLL